VATQWWPRMSRSNRSADDVPVNQSTYEHLRPNGFIDTARPQHRAATLIRQAGRPAEGRLEDDEQVRVTFLDIDDLPAITAMLGRCSRATLYKRFHGFTDGRAHASSTVSDPNEDAYGAWRAGRCVGMATLAVNEEGYGEIGVLVEDAWQRRGAGAALVTALVGRAHELGLPGLVADVLADNYFILPLLARIGAIATTFAYSGCRVRVGFGIPLSGGAIRGDVPVRG
jgi:RimJ/RimL family protein N-acetyltransferase